jgi:ferredoxin/flavodoxin---NADP+ reductase
MCDSHHSTDSGDSLALSGPNSLRQTHYNATLVAIREVQRDLRILRIVLDEGIPKFSPGQYATLGLGNWESRVEGVDEEHLDGLHKERMCKRAYSISCSMLDDRAALRRPADFPYLEFYVALVRHSEKRPPALTPRLFALRAGDRLLVEPHVAGRYTLDAVRPDQDVFSFATGTGEAPHNAMIAQLLADGHRGHIVSAVSVRQRVDAAYLAVHEELMRRYANYYYVVLTTREPENLDTNHPHYVGKRYLQDIVSSGWLERRVLVSLDAYQAHVFLCGNPAMIGIVGHSRSRLSPESGSMLELLLARGFRPDEGDRSGNVHFERYW